MLARARARARACACACAWNAHGRVGPVGFMRTCGRLLDRSHQFGSAVRDRDRYADERVDLRRRY